MKKFGKWIKVIFTTCTYTTRTTYEDRLENCEANREARERAWLLPLPLAQSPPRFDNLPSLFDTDFEDDEEEEQQEQPELDPHTMLSTTLQSLRRSTRRKRHTSTTHRQGRAVVSSSNDDDDCGGEEAAAGAGGAVGGDDVDWENIQEEE